MANRRPTSDQYYRHQYQPYSLVPDNISMPADTLETIIRAIGRASRPDPVPISAYCPSFPSRFTPSRPSPPPVNKGKGGNGNKGKEQGKKGKRGERSKDPRRNAPINQAPHHASSSSSSTSSIITTIPATGPTIPAIPTIVPAKVNIISNPIAIEHVEDEDLSFLNEFATNKGSINGDVMMHGDVAIKESFNI